MSWPRTTRVPIAESLETEVGADVPTRVPPHLEAVGKQERLALVVYTLGGDVNTSWPFINFLRRHCDELVVPVPFWAHSAGTARTGNVKRLTTELYSHSHLIARAEARDLGLPVERPSEHLEDRLLAYYEQLKTDLETLTTCDAFVTRGAAEHWVTIS